MSAPVTIESLEDLRAYATLLGRTLAPKTILLLEGEMGVGKTQFVTYLVEAMGGKETSSPSYAIHNSYEVASVMLEHLDLFRVKDVDDLESTGFWDLFVNADSIVVIEWAERLREFGLESQLPRGWKLRRLRISRVSDGSRIITEV